MFVTIQIVASGVTSKEIEISSELDLAVSTSDRGSLADAVAARARDAALCLLEQIPALPPPASDGFVPLSRLLRHA